MKKILATIICLGLAACHATHQSTNSINTGNVPVVTKPLNFSVIPGEKISGTVHCTSLFGIPLRMPSQAAYGARLDTNEGNFGGDRCTKGAIYNAVVSSDADVILSPQYLTQGKGFLCLPWIGCVYNDRVVTVTGYKGTYQYSEEMPTYVVIH